MGLQDDGEYEVLGDYYHYSQHAEGRGGLFQHVGPVYGGCAGVGEFVDDSVPVSFLIDTVDRYSKRRLTLESGCTQNNSTTSSSGDTPLSAHRRPPHGCSTQRYKQRVPP